MRVSIPKHYKVATIVIILSLIVTHDTALMPGSNACNDHLLHDGLLQIVLLCSGLVSIAYSLLNGLKAAPLFIGVGLIVLQVVLG